MHPLSRLYLEVPYPERLSRLLIFVKWFLIIPHAFVLFFLLLALGVTTFIAWFAMLILGRYPRGLWSFGVSTLAWITRVNIYSWLLRDEYPPFGDGEDYPAFFQLAYPERQSRLLLFVKWLLILPHAFVLYFVGIVAAVFVSIAWLAILFLGRYPRGLFEFVVGYLRWSSRVSAYWLLLTDDYPPFSLQSDFPATGPMGYGPPGGYPGPGPGAPYGGPGAPVGAYPSVGQPVTAYGVSSAPSIGYPSGEGGQSYGYGQPTSAPGSAPYGYGTTAPPTGWATTSGQGMTPGGGVDPTQPGPQGGWSDRVSRGPADGLSR